LPLISLLIAIALFAVPLYIVRVPFPSVRTLIRIYKAPKGREKRKKMVEIGPLKAFL